MENQPLPCNSCRQNTLPICIITTCNRSLLPHNKKLSREKTFTNWWKIRFSQRKFLQIACLSGQPNTMPPKFTEKTFTKSHKISKFKKKISLSKVFPVYNILCLHMHIINYNYLVFIHFLLTIISSEKLPEWATVVSATEVEELP